MVKNLPANAGDERDMGSIPGLGRCPLEGKGYPLQYSSILAWRIPWTVYIVHGVAKSQTWLTDFHFTLPVFWPGEFHGWRTLVGYSPWGHKELDTTEHARMWIIYTRVGCNWRDETWRFWRLREKGEEEPLKENPDRMWEAEDGLHTLIKGQASIMNGQHPRNKRKHHSSRAFWQEGTR